MRTDKENPCRYCVTPKRKVGCQSDCPDRKKWLAARKEEQAMIDAAKAADKDVDAFFSKTVRRNKYRH